MRTEARSPVPAPNLRRGSGVYSSSGNVPADGAKFPTVLDHSMEEAETKEERLENLLGPGWNMNGQIDGVCNNQLLSTIVRYCDIE